MPCYHPIPAYRTAGGDVRMWVEGANTVAGMELPCGNCIGCRTSRARQWAVRCHLELRQHDRVCWTTLTYDDEHLPPGLEKEHLVGFLKRLRRRREYATRDEKRPERLRFFASGEYGETNGRPHYHAILFGTSVEAKKDIEAAWPYGFSRVDPVGPGTIEYVAGYCAKKIGWREEYGDVIDRSTGEVIEERPRAPFVHMSRNPGIGGSAREHWQSWKETAIHMGREIAVPRYLHEAWKANASPAMKEALEHHRYEKSRSRDRSKERREAGELLAAARLNLQARRRKL